MIGRLSIVGLGLLGGSVAKAARAASLACSTRTPCVEGGIDVDEIEGAGARSRARDMGEAVAFEHERRRAPAFRGARRGVGVSPAAHPEAPRT